MLVELYINGQLYRQWKFEFANYPEPFCQVGFEEKERLWQQIIEKCKDEVEPFIRNNPYEFYICLPARVQPADINPQELEKLFNHLTENENSSL